MARPGTWANRNDIEADRSICEPGPRGKKALGRSRDARLLMPQNRFRRKDEIGSRLHLDKTDRARWRPGDEINLTQMRADPPAEYAIELQGQEDRRKRLATSAAALRLFP